MNVTGNIAGRLDHFAATRPDHPAIIWGGRTISYSDLAYLVRRIGGHLADRGIGPGPIPNERSLASSENARKMI